MPDTFVAFSSVVVFLIGLSTSELAVRMSYALRPFCKVSKSQTFQLDSELFNPKKATIPEGYTIVSFKLSFKLTKTGIVIAVVTSG